MNDQEKLVSGNSVNNHTGNLKSKSYLFYVLSALCILLAGVTGYLIYLKRAESVEKNPGTSGNEVEVKSSGLTPSMQPPRHNLNAEKLYYGIDISHYNGPEVSDITQNDSIVFIICKATDGVTFVDPYFDINWGLIRSKNCYLGAYHFYRTDDDPIQQAEFYLQTLEAKGRTDISPIVDIEGASVNENSTRTPAEIQANLVKFLQYIQQKTSREPIIYTGPYFANMYLVNPELAEYRLWLADYTESPHPEIPDTWQSDGYFIWQKTDAYKIDFESTDLDQYQGTIKELLK